jgi:hypothetical protein
MDWEMYHGMEKVYSIGQRSGNNGSQGRLDVG